MQRPEVKRLMTHPDPQTFVQKIATGLSSSWHKTESFRFAEPGSKLDLQPRQGSRPDLAHPAFVHAEPDADLFHGPFLEIIKVENTPVTAGERADGPVENLASFRPVCELLRVSRGPPGVCPGRPESELHASYSYPRGIRLYITSSAAFASTAVTDEAVSRFPPPWDSARGSPSVP